MSPPACACPLPILREERQLAGDKTGKGWGNEKDRPWNGRQQGMRGGNRAPAVEGGGTKLLMDRMFYPPIAEKKKRTTLFTILAVNSQT